MLKVLAYFLLLVSVLKSRTTLGQVYRCPERTCNEITGSRFPPPPLLLRPPPPSPLPPPPPKPLLPKQEVYAVNRLLRLLRTPGALTTFIFYPMDCHSVKYTGMIKCNCRLENNTACGVVEIDLSGRGLTCQIPPEIGNLTHLRSLDLTSNKIYGSIPDSFAKLSNLSELYLGNNMLEGPMPTFLGNLTSLQKLYLFNNWFNESIPNELGNLQSLEYLSLFNNFLSRVVPVELGNISSLKGLYLYDNQLSGELPQQLGYLGNLQDMYLMNNLFKGELPSSFGKLKKLNGFNIQGNNINGTIPEFISNWTRIEKLILMGNNFEGPLPMAISTFENLNYLAITDLAGGGTGVPFPNIQNMESLGVLTLRSCSLTGAIPGYLWNFKYLFYLDLSFNNLTGGIPEYVSLKFPMYIFLRRNKLNGSLPGWLTNLKQSLKKWNQSYADVSENIFTNVTLLNSTISPYLNLFQCCSKESNVDTEWQKADYYCANDKQTYTELYINCGGNATSINGSNYEADLQPYGGSTFFLSKNKTWGYSSMGIFLDADHNQYILNKTCNISMADAPLYVDARIAPISLKYYAFCLKNDEYRVRLHFAEIGWDETRYSSIKKRVFDVEIQGGQHYLRDFNIEEHAGGVNKAITKEFNVTVNDSRLEIHLYWSGNGSTLEPTKYYGPLISAISVFPVRVPLEPAPTKSNLSTIGIAGIVGSALIFGILLLALSWMLGLIGPKKLDGLELYPGGVFNFKKLKAATNNFDPDKRIGGVGSVYKGVLPDETQIAVKQLSAKSKEGAREFINAIGTIYALKHPNLATLMGSCREQNQLLLVYKYMENISLQHALFGPDEVKSKLNWQTRVKICLGVAKGLAYLHDSEMEIIHSNIKPTNILLDKDFTVKISDFGYSQLHDSQLVDAQLINKESTGGSMPKAKKTLHMAPEYVQGLPLTPKADVYSFGIVTLEIVSGQEISTFRSKDQNVYLLNEAYRYKDEGNITGLVDRRLGSEYKYDEALTILNLAMQCVSPRFDIRPTMSDVVKILEGKKTFDINSISVPHPKDPAVSKAKSTLSQSTQSGSTSQEEASSTTISPSTTKQADDSIISTD